MIFLKTGESCMKEKCRILYGLEAADGGALTHLTYLVCNLNKKLFRITVIISDKRSFRVHKEIEKMERCGVKVIVLGMTRSIHPVKDLISFFKILKHIRTGKYDIIHAHSSKAGVLFRMAGWLNRVNCIVYTPHCFYFQCERGIRKLFFLCVEKMMSILTDHIVVSHNEKYEALKYLVAKSNKLIDINNAIPLNKCPPFEMNRVLRAQLNIENDVVVVGAMGRLTRQKDWPTFIKAANETLKTVDNVVFLIIGEGEELLAIKRLIQELRLEKKVIVTGYRNDIGKLYNLIDIYINTSLWEGLPYVLVEAMGYRKPIIATNLNYGAIIEDEKNGYLVNRKDYKIMANRIISLINNSALRKTMGKNGLYLSKKHLSFRRFILKHQDLYLSSRF
jgi:glycosyltransferase involved in cell wall biosynthesis